MEQNSQNKYYSHLHNFYYPVLSFSRFSELPALQFEQLHQLLDNSPINTKDGIFLRKNIIEENVLKNLLNYLSVVTHNHKTDSTAEIETLKSSMNSLRLANKKGHVLDTKNDIYWAKGPGNLPCSCSASCAEDNFMKKKYEEQQVILIFKILSSFINPGDLKSSTENSKLPLLVDDFQKSCIIPTICLYLRNDSVLDIAKRIQLYRAIMKVLRGLSVTSQLIDLLITKQENCAETITTLLCDLAACFDNYANKIFKVQTNELTDYNDDDGLEILIKDIQETAAMVKSVTDTNNKTEKYENPPNSLVKYETLKEKYLAAMKEQQFDSFEIIVESENNYKFTVPFHFENWINAERKSIGRENPKRMKRIYQELMTLEKSLPLSYNSSIFLRYDPNRIDLMKVLIIGPSNTLYANGCFEFDVYFPHDYPDSPMLVAFTTALKPSIGSTPSHFIFNPNFHPNGKVCMSILNTWPGTADVRWNPETSSLLQILVTIQSFVLVSEPYFNEPGFEKIRGTPKGDIESRNYNYLVYSNCVIQAICNQILNPSPCFKDVIKKHFWYKRIEICEQIEKWIDEMTHQESVFSVATLSLAFKIMYEELQSAFRTLSAP